MTDPSDLPTPAIVPLDEQACLERLGQSTLGRVSLSLDALPEIFPVQYALLGRDPVFRTMPGHKLITAADGQVLSMGIDDWDPDRQIGWRVVVTGPAQRLLEPHDLEAAGALPLKPWTADSDWFVRISASLLRGNEIRDPGAVAAPGT